MHPHLGTINARNRWALGTGNLFVHSCGVQGEQSTTVVGRLKRGCKESGVEPKALRDWWTMQGGGGGRNQMGKGGKVGL